MNSQMHKPLIFSIMKIYPIRRPYICLTPKSQRPTARLFPCSYQGSIRIRHSSLAWTSKQWLWDLDSFHGVASSFQNSFFPAKWKGKERAGMIAQIFFFFGQAWKWLLSLLHTFPQPGSSSIVPIQVEKRLRTVTRVRGIGMGAHLASLCHSY